MEAEGRPLIQILYKYSPKEICGWVGNSEAGYRAYTYNVYTTSSSSLIVIIIAACVIHIHARPARGENRVSVGDIRRGEEGGTYSGMCLRRGRGAGGLQPEVDQLDVNHDGQGSDVPERMVLR